jgi:lipoprotein NlpI
MMQIYALYKGHAAVDEVLAAARSGNPTPDALSERLFYAHLYIGLYYEAAGDAKQTRKHIELANRHKIGHYMGDVARVHLQLMRR